ncbi:hypothetical protein B0A55_02218 [Friedmanniomyces simplex]|uniref:Mid2 domain-containing protein n=1 Tax=Friedmanniomyces simplex TaxID=329884 RepID=A0A4U0XRN5_9PEZI|nr:hypothetical protein B0A55_02218 [Friedmanniomyces simplex]
MGNMRLHSIPVPLLQLIASILLAPSPLVQAKPHPAASNLAGFHFNDLFARYDCAGTYCGFSSQLCCTAGSTCYTDASDQAQCGAGAATAAVAAGGYWSTYTSIYTEVDTVLTTALMSTYVQSVAAAATATAGCNYAVNETPCGSICCASNQYCASAGQCAAAVGAGSSGYYSSYATPTPTPGVIVGGGGATGSAAIRGTSSSLVLVTSTQTPTTTEPFMAPVQTGANITLTSQGAQHSGLSGGAIAGIVIGVLLGLFLLGLLCFYCCLRGLWNGFAALFGGGKRKRRTVEVEEYERRSHHASGRGGGGGGRTWYGASRPARGSSRYEERNERKSKGNGVFGLGVGLAGLWALLGLKRQRGNKRRQEEKSEYSYSSDYYTSASEYR